MNKTWIQQYREKTKDQGHNFSMGKWKIKCLHCDMRMPVNAEMAARCITTHCPGRINTDIATHTRNPTTTEHTKRHDRRRQGRKTGPTKGKARECRKDRSRSPRPAMSCLQHDAEPPGKGPDILSSRDHRRPDSLATAQHEDLKVRSWLREE